MQDSKLTFMLALLLISSYAFGLTTEAGSNTYTKIPINVTNNASINLTNINLSSICRIGWDANTTAIDVSTSGVNFDVICNQTNIIKKSRSYYNISTSVTVNQNVTGFMTVLINNTDTLNYTNILVNSTSLLPSGWVNASSSVWSVTLANGSVNVTNHTLITASPLILERNVNATVDCVGMPAAYADYCLNAVGVNLGNGTVRYTYTYRAYLNNTDNITKEFKIYYNMPIARFTNWDTRVVNSENVTVNASTLNLSLSSNLTSVTLLIDTNHTNSSIAQGDSQVEISWLYDVAIVGGTGGGIQPPYGFGMGDYNFTLTPNYRITAVPSGREYLDFVVKNTGTQPETIRLSIEQQNDTSWLWAGILDPDTIALRSQRDIIVNAGDSYVVRINVAVPSNINQTDYAFRMRGEIVTPSGINSVHYVAVYIHISTGDIGSDIAAFLMEDVTAQFFGVKVSLPYWGLSIIGVIITIAVTLAIRSYAKKRRTRRVDT